MKSDEEKQRPFKGKSKRDEVIEQNTVSADQKPMARPNNAKTCFEHSLHYTNGEQIVVTYFHLADSCNVYSKRRMQSN